MNLQPSFHPIMPQYKEPRLQGQLVFNTTTVHQLVVMFLDDGCSLDFRAASNSPFHLLVVAFLRSEFSHELQCWNKSHSQSDISFPILLTEEFTEPTQVEVTELCSRQRAKSEVS